jgi:putative ABC transport system ATP-binding protein
MQTAPSNPVVELNDVRFAWPGTSGAAVKVADFQLRQGEQVFLYGPSGSGKSTLLNLLGGIAHPVSGTVSVLGQDMARLRWWQRDRFRARHIGVIFQQFNLIPYLSVLDNVLLACHFAHLMPSRNTGKTVQDATAQDTTAQDTTAYSAVQQSTVARGWLTTKQARERERAGELLARLGLASSLFNRHASALSVGQQQRVAVARALINEPALILADEPTSALDSDARDDFMALLQSETARYQASLVFVSHDRQLSGHFSQHRNVRDLMHWQEVA